MGLLTLLDSRAHRLTIYRHLTVDAPTLHFSAEANTAFTTNAPTLDFTAASTTAFTAGAPTTSFTVEKGA